MKLLGNFLRINNKSISQTMSQKKPLALISCGSFNPITNMHLRMFEIAKDYFRSKYDVVAGIISPVGNYYKKKGLIDSKHRCEMIKLALKGNTWVSLCDWEASQPEWTPTLESLKYHKIELAKTYGDSIELKFLCGADLVETFSHPGVWREDHIKEICANFGLAIINRAGSNPEKFIYEHDTLYANKHNLYLINDWIANEISSTKIRRAIARDESVKYLIGDLVEDYIKENKLYV